MPFHISLDGHTDLAARIYRQLRDGILDGRLRAGERLPPTRELARELDVSRNTVAVAYERLTAEGFLSGHVGRGTFVSAEPVARAERAAPAGSGVRPVARWRSLPALPGEDRSAPAFDFRVGAPDPALFPLRTWRRLVGQALRPSLPPPSGYADPAGLEALRVAIARHIGAARSVRAGGEDLVVTQGAQQALDLIGRVLIEPGTRVAVEDPGYPPAERLFAAHGARITKVPVDAEGLDVAALAKGTRLIYTTPSHQFPLGTPMSLARRAALLAWAERNDAVIVEDDYDSEYRFSDRPLEPLQSLDRHGRVIYVGSFSKTLLPMLRLGFLVAPASLRPALRQAKQLTDWHGDLVTQAALASFIDEGLLARHVRKATREYSVRRERILAFVRDEPGDLLEVVPSSAGLHLCALLRPHATVTVDGLVAEASRAGVAVESLAAYGGTRAGLVIGYGLVGSDRVDEGLALLGESISAARGVTKG
ncbi:PLP-dependent aminotransferase family protein [Amycolatopsis roodepoortensis]|uniref:GntR family transcriptional regulator/MocR family aminotransferase n=1 Tax=Amycolatopsis roodepoortensis TaxID=700274 RepID=A0ABR9KYG4_9PSEU|nr:PLP-dependent aminotransferase family protein [Amycolatopsis roodepoortensis]MBE1573409.1 GntR family transcriptional regulator/MocR family aminotransferase [Amycolatopsis roodepoortensis]